jgi:RNA-binding protein YhbY
MSSTTQQVAKAPAPTRRTTAKKPAPTTATADPLLAIASSGSAILRAPLRADVVQRDDDEEASLAEETLDVAQAGPAMTGAQTGMDIVNDDAFAVDMATGDEQDSLLGATDQSALGGAGLGLFSAVTGFFAVLKELYDCAKSGQAEDAIAASIEAVLKAGDIVKSSISIAEKGGGAEIAAAVAPGLDIAFSCVSLIGNIVSLYRLHRASWAEGKALDKAEAGGDFATALGTVHGRTLRKLALTWVQTAGDIIMIIGGIAQFAVGPWGTAVKFGGAMVKVVGAASGVIAEHMEASATRAARDDYDQAMLSGDATKMKAATTNRLSKDALFAVQEMLTKGTTIPEGQTDIAPEMKTVFAAYGLGPSFLKKFADAKAADGADGGPQQKKLLGEAEAIIMKFVGASKDPKTISESITAGLSAVWSWFKRLTGIGSVTAQPGTTTTSVTMEAEKIATPIVRAYAAKKAKTGANGIKPIVLTNELKSSYQTLVGTYAKGVADEAARNEKLDAIDTGFYLAISKAHSARLLERNFPIEQLKVVRGVVYFPFPYPAPVAAAAKAPAQAAAQPQPAAKPAAAKPAALVGAGKK